MRYLLTLTVIIFSGCIQTHAQKKILDSLNSIISRVDVDTTKVLLMIDIASLYQFHDSDSALVTINNAIKLAREIGFRRGEFRALCRRGEVYHLRSELPLAVEDELKVIQLSQENNYPDIEAEGLTFLATIYLELAEYRKALGYLYRAKKINDGISIQSLFGGAKEIPPYTIMNIGNGYEKLNLLDSAMHFYTIVLNQPIRYSDQQRADLYARIGNVERRKQNYAAATNYFRNSIAATEKSNDLLNRSIAFYQLALSYYEQKEMDSARNYARAAYQAAVKSSYRTVVLDASNLLASLYKEKGILDSAFYFQQKVINMKDSLFGLDNFHKLQLLVLSEQQRIQQLNEDKARTKTRMQLTGLLAFVAVSIFIAIVLWRSNKQQKKAIDLLNEKNAEIEKQSETLKLTLSDLKSTQSQLIQSEKMASLGELTAGIAHEIQNPLNFINNFSEVNKELIRDLKSEIQNGNFDEVKAIANDIESNEEKIVHHGKRADAIVKGMLQHSRSSTGQKELTDINALCDEYLRLAYHGLRAKDKSFNAKFKTDLDPTLPKANVVPQDFGRVILNLINNAFYAVSERLRQNQPDNSFEPTVTVSTKYLGDKIEICVKDNGSGIPESIKEKIFQPFFTTKPTGQGTGLGLSLSYDIVKAHGGELKVTTHAGQETTFTLNLPQ